MKTYLLMTLIFSVSVSGFAKENHKWNKAYKPESIGKYHDDDDKKKDDDEKKKDKDKYYQHRDAAYGKASPNVPAKVAESFYREFPGAQNPSWSKYKGNWRVAFNNAGYRTITTYHANGDRLSTRNITRRPVYTAPNSPNPANYGGIKTSPANTKPDPAKYGGIPATPAPAKPDPTKYGGMKTAPTNTAPATKPDPTKYGGIKTAPATTTPASTEPKPDPKKYGGM